MPILALCNVELNEENGSLYNIIMPDSFSMYTTEYCDIIAYCIGKDVAAGKTVHLLYCSNSTGENSTILTAVHRYVWYN